MSKVRMVRNKAKQGLDCARFEVAFQGDLKSLPEQALISRQGKQYGTVGVSDGKATVKLVLPRFVRNTNIQPFTMMDAIY
ncbi:hypothetical protein ACH6CV_17020, partial [Bacillota bacterium Meth-B3]